MKSPAKKRAASDGGNGSRFQVKTSLARRVWARALDLMINAITLAPVLFLLCVAVSLMFMNRARRDLTVEQKAAIFDAAPKAI